ncbi:CocE/NonD family hydrolase [Sediminispirochaeta bajacaliforniensis]|uniref:CocE/NonD family hydrolase n=1 Tax=Sediminispirochaeta bajacaliforniensis TaxID=148 RepID=UPI00036E357F|nr:CocE/NonD family hydrolase [Sediminispirochaeta bajacaliforniensis]
MKEYKVMNNIMIPMKDDVKLAMDIYFPEGDSESYPVILERTPYGKREANDYDIDDPNGQASSRQKIASFYNKHGYVVIFQDCRGRYDSEGVFIKYFNEASDGQYTIQWIRKQPWCNGKVGVMGFSYTSHAAMALGCLLSEGIDCMFIDSGGFSNAYFSGIRQGGAFELKQLIWAFLQAQVSPAAIQDPIITESLKSEDIFAWMDRMPLKRGHSLLRNFPEYEDIAFSFWEKGTYGAYWKQLGINTSEYYDRFIDTPIFLISGWYDPYVKTILENYEAFSKRHQNPVYLMMGPWTHNNRAMTIAGEVDFSAEALIHTGYANSYQELKLAWFDKFLKGKDVLPEDGKKVKIFIMGGGSGKKNDNGTISHGGHWFSADSWPLPNTIFVPYYFHANGSLSDKKSTLSESFIEYIFDPRNPVPSVGGTITSGEPIMRGGAYDQKEGDRFFGSKKPYLPLEARDDIVVFQTSILDEDKVIAGPIKARLWISSDCKDTDFTIKLIDVYPISESYPQGFAMNITDGIMRVRYRNSFENPELMVPGEIYEVFVEAFSTANLFKKGHRIRIDVSSSNYPHFDVNHNTGDPEGKGQVMLKAKNRLYLDKEHASYVDLPIVNSL